MTDDRDSNDFRPLMQDLLRLGMAGAAGYANRAVDRIQLEYITNPYGRQPPHILVFPDGRAEPMTPFQLPVPGYAPDVLAVELLGAPGQPPSEDQIERVRVLGYAVRDLLPGKIAFCGNTELVDVATAALVPEEVEEADNETEVTDEVAEPAPQPSFLHHEKLTFAEVAAPSAARAAEPISFTLKPAKVQDIFDILGTPQESRVPLAPGSIFNTFKPGQGAEPTQIRVLFKAPARTITRLVVVPSHDSFKPEPDDGDAFSLDELRKADQRLGMGEFRGHYLLAKNGTLIPARSIDASGNCWPGKNDGSLQIVLAGNGKAPTVEQRRTLFEYAHVMRRHYEQPLQASVRDIVFVEGLIGLDPNGVMQPSLANPGLIDAELPQGKSAGKAARAV